LTLALKQIGGERRLRQLGLVWPDIEVIAERLGRHLTLQVPGPDGAPLLAACLRAGLQTAAPHRYDLYTAQPLITFVRGVLQPLPVLLSVRIWWPDRPCLWDPLTDEPLESLCAVMGPPRIDRCDPAVAVDADADPVRRALAARLLDDRNLLNIGGDLARLLAAHETGVKQA